MGISYWMNAQATRIMFSQASFKDHADDNRSDDIGQGFREDSVEGWPLPELSLIFTHIVASLITWEGIKQIYFILYAYYEQNISLSKHGMPINSDINMFPVTGSSSDVQIEEDFPEVKTVFQVISIDS